MTDLEKLKQEVARIKQRFANAHTCLADVYLHAEEHGMEDVKHIIDNYIDELKEMNENEDS